MINLSQGRQCDDWRTILSKRTGNRCTGWAIN